MVYTVSVPLANQKISATQAPIQANFAFINSSMQLNHVFNANVAGPDGAHNRLDFPNQGADIVVSQPGTALTQYAIGGNLFSWNGSKQPVSGITLKGVTSFATGSDTLLFTVPTECTGYIVFTSTQPPGTATTIISTIHFVSTNGRLSFSTSSTGIRATNVIEGVYTAAFSAIGSATTNTAWKAIYWPV